jgi:hypothetical protein
MASPLLFVKRLTSVIWEPSFSDTNLQTWHR